MTLSAAGQGLSSGGFCALLSERPSRACFPALPESLQSPRRKGTMGSAKMVERNHRSIARSSLIRVHPFIQTERACRTTSARRQLSTELRIVEEGRRTISRRAFVTSALPVDVSDAAVAGAVPLFIFLILRVGVYFRLQFITAAMLGRHVPRGGSRVVDLNLGGGRNLYYLPKDVLQVIALNPKGSPQVLENQAINAGVPIQIQQGPAGKVAMAANSADAVVSVNFLGQLSSAEVTEMVSEIARVLKPGKPLVFIESARGEGVGIRAVQQLWWAALSAIGKGRRGTDDLLPFLKDAQVFRGIEVDRILDFQDPHVVGVAFKDGDAVEKIESSKQDASRETRRNKVSSKGFK